MSSIYRVNPDGSTEALDRTRCPNEDRDLQRVLERNLDLLPGEQIDPDEPRRWLLVKREMPVPDPASGTDRWSVDFVLLDQSATPTFVECKRFADTRARREVVGQMLEYAANGHFYWTKEDLQRFAEETAKANSKSLEDALPALRPDDDLDVADFFARAESNLREGQVRLVFFLEEAPQELKSIVDFLNKQTERTEILLVEAKRYTLGDVTVVAPTLFGYSEEARRTKRVLVATPSSGRRQRWDESAFFKDAAARLKDVELRVVREFYEFCSNRGFTIAWGTGANRGSFNVKSPRRCPRSFLTVWSDGQLTFNFGWLNGSPEADTFREEFKSALIATGKFAIPDVPTGGWVSLDVPAWMPDVGALRDVLLRFAEEGASCRETE